MQGTAPENTILMKCKTSRLPKMVSENANAVKMRSGEKRTGMNDREKMTHAVRWARRKLKRLMTLDYTKWHGTKDAQLTFCGRPIPLGLEGTFLPETDDDLTRMDCKRCVAHLRGQGR